METPDVNDQPRWEEFKNVIKAVALNLTLNRARVRRNVTAP